MSSDKKIYYVSSDVEKAHGYQLFKVLASSEEEAVKVVSNGGGDFESEEIEVSERGDWSVDSVAEIGDDEPPPIYTSETPERAGYYWFRFGGLTPEVIKVKNQANSSLVATTSGIDWPVSLRSLVKEGGQFGPRINPPGKTESS